MTQSMQDGFVRDDTTRAVLVSSGEALSAPVVVANVAGNNLVVANVPGQRIQVLGYCIVNDVATAQSMRFRTASTAYLMGPIQLPQSIGGTAQSFAPDGTCGLFTCNVNEALNLSLTAATAVNGYVTYRLIT